MNDYIIIEYSNSADFGNILYQNDFANKLYLDADVSKPEYELLEDGIENGDGEFIPTFQKWAKKYSIEFYAQEFLVDALTLMALHDQINVTLKNGESSNVTDIEIAYKWDSNIECWAEVTIKFSTSYITRTKCQENMVDWGTDPVFSVDDIYDADDGGAGQAFWEGTGATSNSETVFNTAYADGEYSGDPLGVYKYIGGAWVKQDVEDGQFIDVLSLSGASPPECKYLVKSGAYLYRTPHLASVTDNGACGATVVAYANYVENTFYVIEVSPEGEEDWSEDPNGGYLASEFLAGVVITPFAVDDDFDFRIKWYTHNGDIGYSNLITEGITGCP